MKKLFLVIIVFFVALTLKAQHFIPLKLSISPDEFTMAAYGGFSLDKGGEPDFLQSLSSSGQTGFVVNAMFRERRSLSYSQFMLDVNPILINWDPFTWNKLIKQPVDSFYVVKLPFAEDAFLHIGWHYNILTQMHRVASETEYTLKKTFIELYYRPYSLINQQDINYRFSVFNVSTGVQFGYVRKDVPTLGNFLIALSGQLNFMAVNEQDSYLHNFTALTGYTDKNFWGPGMKLSVQTNFLNIYIEGRQYYGTTTGAKFTQDATILVGAFGNFSWLMKKDQSQNNKDNNKGHKWR